MIELLPQPRTAQERLLAAAKTAVAVAWSDKESGILYPRETAKQELREAIEAVEREGKT